MELKTVVIFVQEENDPVVFFVLKGDYSYFDNCFIEYPLTPRSKQEELCEFMYNKEGELNFPPLKKFPKEEVKEGALVITCGFLP